MNLCEHVPHVQHVQLVLVRTLCQCPRPLSPTPKAQKSLQAALLPRTRLRARSGPEAGKPFLENRQLSASLKTV